MATKTPIDFSIGYENIDGLHTKSFSCKLPYTQKKFIHDIEILTETWGSCEHDKEIEGYRLIDEIEPQKEKGVSKGRASGGLLIYCKSHLFKYIKRGNKTPYYIWLEINKTIFHSLHETIKVCIAYNPPINSNYCNKTFYEDISTELLTTHSLDTPFLLIGDLNSRTGELTDFYDSDDDNKGESDEPPTRKVKPTRRENCDKKVNQMGNKLIDMCKANDLQILNGRTLGDRTGSFTFFDQSQGASTIDLAIASDTLQPMIKSLLIQHQTEISKHCKIVLRIKNLKESVAQEGKSKDNYPWIPTGKKYLWQDHSAENLARALTSPEVAQLTEELEQFLDAGLIEQASNKMDELYTKAADCALQVRKPKKTFSHPYKHKQKPKRWFDEECRTRKNMCRKYAIRKKQNPADTVARESHSIALKEYKQLCAKKKHEFEQRQINELDQMLNEDHTEFWKKWKSFGDTYRSERQNMDGERWEKYFKELYQDKSKHPLPPLVNPPQADLSQLNAPFTIEELLYAIYKKLKNKKAAGLDKLISEFFKASPEAIHLLLLRLINIMYTNHLVPKNKNLGVITPIHKEGPKDDPDNYRGICISSALTKLLCTMMNVRLNTFIQENQVLNKEQIGFVTNNRTPDHVLTMRSVVNKYVEDQKQKVYACFIDFKKAFDTVWHDGLFLKLQQIGIKGNFLETLRNMYKNTKCAIKLGDQLTQFFPCMKGVRQGDPLSPTLFNIFLNDLFNELRKENCDPVSLNDTDYFNALAYADDIVILSTTAKGLQKALDITEKYCEKWRLTINHKKTKSMVFSRGNQKIKASFSMNGIELENVAEFKYLGITVHKKGCSFNPTLKYLRTKATRAIYALRAKVNINSLPLQVALKLFDATIKPILLYGSEVWEPYLNQDSTKWDNNDIEKTYTQFLKQILGLNRSTTTIMVRGELNRHSLQDEILRRNINYIGYIHHRDQNPYVKQAYDYETRRSLTSTTFFTTVDKHTEELHKILGSFHPYNNPYENLFELSRDKLKLLTHELFHNEWKERISQSSKADTYKKFKSEMKFETYLSHPNRKERVTMTKLRVSDHKLMIEEGRWNNIPKPGRKCPMCREQVEDEIHFLTDCQLYGSHDKYWNTVHEKVPQTRTLSNTDQFIYIMTQEDPELTQMTLKMTHEWMKLRIFLREHFYQ